MLTKKIKLPPQSLEAEISVLGSLMIDKDAIYQIADILRSDDFYDEKNSIVYDAALKLFEKNKPIDILSVTQALKEGGKLKGIGGSTYLTKLIDSVPTASHLNYYARVVRDKKILRDLINASARVTEEAFNERKEVDEFLDEVESQVFSISQRSLTQKFVPVKEILPEAYERIVRLHSGEKKTSGVPSGFQALDNYLSGFHDADLIIVGARPSLGKTAFVLNMVQHIVTNEKVPAGFFSLEMSRDQIIDRLISSEAGVPLWSLRTGNLKDDTDFELIQHALDKLSNAPLYIDDTPSLNILQMRSMARRLQAEKGLGILVVDYLQLIQPKTNSDNIVQQVTEISRGLKSLARELKIPVIAVSQLSRAVDQRESRIPRLSDLRESGSIEQDSDVVLFIYRKDMEKMNVDATDSGMTEIIIAKHRNGPLGTVKLKFDPETVTFRCIDNLHTI